MAENKLPTGVGKKIVEALKKQNDIDADINQVTEIVENNDIDDEMTISTVDSIEQTDDLSSYESLITDDINDLDLNNIEETSEQTITEYNQESPLYEEPQQFSFEPASSQTPIVNQPAQTNYNSYAQPDFNNPSNNYGEMNMPLEEETKNINMPSNVAVLKKLISQLPAGVSKQTGAQIIKQTMEALGISMNGLLTEAQHFQDELNNSIRDCMNTVNEYKQNIMTLEKQVVDYQKQAKSFNDLISLFIMTEK